MIVDFDFAASFYHHKFKEFINSGYKKPHDKTVDFLCNTYGIFLHWSIRYVEVVNQDKALIFKLTYG